MLRTLRAASSAVRGAGSRSLSTAVHGLCLAGRSAAPRALATVSAGPSFTLPDLRYDYGALEPALSGEIMRLHHSKHHAAYVANFNAALAQYADAEAKGDVARMIALQPAIKFNGGGAAGGSPGAARAGGAASP